MPTDFAGYSLPDDSTPFPGGQAFATTHPTLGTPVTLRKFRAEWLTPADSVDRFATHMRTAFSASHPNLVKLIDAGLVDGQPYAVCEPFDGANLESLVKDIGPMPTFLAADFIRQAALGLDAAHDRGLIHGDIRPAHLLVGPLITSSKKRADGTNIQRPGPTASAKLSDLGLVPNRPTGRDWAALDPLATKALAFLPPERIDSTINTPAGDLYGLGATLFFLLTGRAPFVANSAGDVVDKIATGTPAPLATLRPDLPVGLVDLVQKLLAKNPSERPATAADVAGALVPFAEPDPVPLTAAPPEVQTTDMTESTPTPGGWTVAEYSGPTSGVEQTFAPAAEHHEDAFAAAHSEAAAAPVEKKKTKMTAEDRQKLKTWFIIGGVFWGLALILWLVLLSQSGCFGGGNKDVKPTDNSPPKKDRRR
ncbi:hypothetical protein BH11PLA2_BH11PLA2_40590 [soil metagenome]